MNSKTFTIVVGVDYSDLSELALREAATMSKLRAPSHVHVIHAIQYIPPTAQDALELTTSAATSDSDDEKNAEKLRAYVEKVLGTGERTNTAMLSVDRLSTHVRRADPAEAIAQLASDLEADLVVVGTHGHRGIARLLLGSVAEGVIRLAPCPVLVVRRVGTSAATNVPRIEPPCPRCLETRKSSAGKEFWCAQHREHQLRRHTYHFGKLPG